MRVLGITILIVTLTVNVGSSIPDLPGAWAMIQIYPQLAVLPIAGEISRSSTVAQFVEITQDGNRLMMMDR